MEAELGNVRAALSWAGAADPETTLRLASALWRFWENGGRLIEGRRWLEQALARGEAAPPVARAEALLSLAHLRQVQGEVAETRGLLLQSVALWKGAGEQEGVSRALNALGNAVVGLGEHDAAIDYYEQALALTADTDAGVRAMRVRLNLAGAYYLRGEPDRSESAIAAVRSQLREAGYHEGLSYASLLGAMMARDRGELDRATTMVKASMRALEPCGDAGRYLAVCLEEFARIDAARGRLRRAARWLGAAAALRSASATIVEPSLRSRHERTIAATRSVLGDDAYAAAWKAGARSTAAEIIAEALSVPEESKEATVSPAPSATAGTAGRLTAREQQILGLLGAGLSDREIAAALCISSYTATTHVKRIRRKLGVASRTAAVGFAGHPAVA